MQPAKLQPALLGGLTIGVLSALPVINLANCCCAWILFGGGLAAYLMQQNHPEPIQAGDGAIVGLLAGVVGAVLFLILAPLIGAAFSPIQAGMVEQVLRNSADLPPELRTMLENASNRPAIGIGLLLLFIPFLFVSMLFASLGGLFGALMFKKSQPPVIPPPIPQ